MAGHQPVSGIQAQFPQLRDAEPARNLATSRPVGVGPVRQDAAAEARDADQCQRGIEACVVPGPTAVAGQSDPAESGPRAAGTADSTTAAADVRGAGSKWGGILIIYIYCSALKIPAAGFDCMFL